jgi:hypothetical protein
MEHRWHLSLLLPQVALSPVAKDVAGDGAPIVVAEFKDLMAFLS